MSNAEALSDRRGESRSSQRREAILEAARQSFLLRGYDGTTMSAIAEEAGGSRATLWGHFPSKDALFDAVMDRLTEQFHQELTLILNPTDSVETVLQRFCSQYVAKITSPDSIAIHRLVIGEVNRSPEIGRIFHSRAPGLTRKQLADYFAGAVARGAMPPCDTRAAAHQLAGLCLSGSHQRLILGVQDSVTDAELAGEVAGIMKTFRKAYLA